ncbi:glycosyltransferase family 2 protein [uncultured Alsobacter sp.]|uniref:glycosyltransferase family 2 protein n=1 Tax=uncultured Alsobacter sp. TaxID=1748258 RepID=UPI0025CF7690|nr:glycosyltransferase family 2 protein [uncultured Alsobacter sp.]
MTSVSVVIPAYNARETVGPAVRSVLEQSRAPDQVVVVDDGSTDGTGAVLAEFGNRIVVVRQNNGGLAAARNAGCSQATGDMIAFMDADDLAHPDRIALQLAAMEARPDAVLCHTEFSSFGDGDPIERFQSRYYRVMQVHADLAKACFASEGTLLLEDVSGAGSTVVQVGRLRELQAHGNAVHPPTLLFRRSLLESIGAFDPAIRNMCDWEWLFRASGQGPFCFIEKPLLDYRLSPGQLSGPRHKLEAIRDIIAIAERIKATEPTLYFRERRTFDREMGTYQLDLARALATSDKTRAFHAFRRALSLGCAPAQAGRVLLRLLAPAAVLRRRAAAH